MAKILVVDDVEDNIKLLQYDLEDDGYDVITAQDGEEALLVASEELPDVILLDIMMPKLGGIETCKYLKQDSELAKIPVIMLSAKSQDQDIIEGLDVGALDYISKPINYPIVAARIRSAIRVKEYEDSVRAFNQKLQVAKENVEMALRARSSFLATMSHEIRTPITTIMGLSEILMGDVKGDMSPFDSSQAAQSIFTSSRYLLEVINNILDLSKAESGNLEVEELSCSLFDIFRDVEAIVNLKAVEKNLSFTIDYKYPLPKLIQSDPTRLKQVLINFVNNAIKFTDKGSVQVKVIHLKEENKLQIEVIDTGIGMDENELSKLFQAFQQANKTITRRFGGTGLGLTISKEIIEKLNGSIEVESRKGEGSIFRFKFPIGSRDLEFVDKNPLLNTDKSYSDTDHYKGRVLLVEDDKENQRIISYFMKKKGVEVETAEDGEIAVEKALEGQFDLIFMDMNLPKLDGISAVKAIKEAQLKTPIVALTATQNREDIENLLQAGCKDYLPKPFQRCELYDCLRRYLTGESVLEEDEVEHFTSDLSSKEYAERILQYRWKLQSSLTEIKELLFVENWTALRNQTCHLFEANLFGFQKIYLFAKQLEEQVIGENKEACRELIEYIEQEIAEASGQHSKIRG